jgi:NitT/TauT family transport system substrate-binding protein
MQIMHSRRRFLAGASSAVAAGLAGTPRSFCAEPPPETTTVRFAKNFGICVAPQYVAGQLLQAEGFNDVRYLERRSGVETAMSIARGEVDFGLVFAATLVNRIAVGDPLAVVAGLHVGCYELFGNQRVHTIADLKGKGVGVQALGTSAHLLLSAMATYVGLDPAADINWVTSPEINPMELFADGKIDAFIGYPPEPQDLRARGIGRVVVNTALDRPWSQYFCCMLATNRSFVQERPVATKRVLRAIIKAADLCVAQPATVARQLVDGGFTPRYDFALQTLNEVLYGTWREYDPEDTIRFYALRLHEAGMITSEPNKIIADGTDWRFLDELKRELKT